MSAGAVIRGDADAALDSVSVHEDYCTRGKQIIEQAVEEMAQEIHVDAGDIGGAICRILGPGVGGMWVVYVVGLHEIPTVPG